MPTDFESIGRVVSPTDFESASGAYLPPANSLLGSQSFDRDAMTPEALMIYLSTRIGSLDDQMGSIFERQKTSEKVRMELRGIQEELTRVPTNKEEKVQADLDPAIVAQIHVHLENIKQIDLKLGTDIEEHLRAQGQILGEEESRASTSELNASKDYLNLVAKDLESGSQMDMITLQSLMGARQTAIQLSTNLISALNESQKSVVSNIR